MYRQYNRCFSCAVRDTKKGGTHRWKCGHTYKRHQLLHMIHMVQVCYIAVTL